MFYFVKGNKIKSSTGKTPVLDIGALRKIKTGEIKVCDPNTFRKLYLRSSLFDPAALLPLLGSKRKKKHGVTVVVMHSKWDLNVPRGIKAAQISKRTKES